MPSYYVVMFAFRGTTVAPTAAIENVLNAHVQDWARYNVDQYIVRYEGHSKTLYEALKQLLDVSDSVLVMGANPNQRYGWVPPVIVEWLRRQDEESL